jgi:uncharacterized protein
MNVEKLAAMIEDLDDLKTAAAQGGMDPQYNLGVAYEFGEGVTQDYAEAAKWFRKAAAQGHEYALFNLASLYAKGFRL